MCRKNHFSYSKKEIENILKEKVFDGHALELYDFRFGLNTVLKGNNTLLKMFGEWRSNSRDSNGEHAFCKLARTIMLDEPLENIPLYLNGVPDHFYESRHQKYRIDNESIIECAKMLARYRLKKGA